MKITLLLLHVFIVLCSLSRADISVVGSQDLTTDIGFSADVSASDLVNKGSPSLLAGPTYSTKPGFGSGANNDGSIGRSGRTSGALNTITFFGGSANDEFSITYTLDTSVNYLGYDITSIQTIQGSSGSIGDQKNQNYVVEVSTVDSAAFTHLATVGYFPFPSTSDGAASSKVNITEGVTGLLAKGVDEIRFTYTVPDSEGAAGSPAIREIDVFGVATGLDHYNKDLGAIWFIGDSITQSNADGDSDGSPRKSLYDLLMADGANFSFTGHYTKNIDGLPSSGSTPETNLYHYHSGISGSVIGDAGKRTNMTSRIPHWWGSSRLASTRPNIVLIMLGTNDINKDADVGNAPNRVKLLVDTIFSQVGSTDPVPAVFVAQIPPNRKSPDARQRVIDFNEALPAIISTLKSEGKDVTLVDQFSLINANAAKLMKDSLHTNSAGNDVLASQWFEAIKTRFAVPTNTTIIP